MIPKIEPPLPHKQFLSKREKQFMLFLLKRIKHGSKIHSKPDSKINPEKFIASNGFKFTRVGKAGNN